MNINFYQTEDIFHKAIAPILIKILEENKKVLIFTKDQTILNQIDEGLWSFSKTKFIPHGTNKDDLSPEEQPVFITNKEENINQANYLITLDEVEDNFISNFEKILYFFNNQSIKKSKSLWRQYKLKSAKLNFYKKDQGKWICAA